MNQLNAPVDLTGLRSITEGDAETEKLLVAAFVEQNDKNLETLKNNYSAGSHEAWLAAAHMFKGSSASLGAKALSQLCHQAQHAASNADVRHALFVQIEREYALVKAYLRKIGLLT